MTPNQNLPFRSLEEKNVQDFTKAKICAQSNPFDCVLLPKLVGLVLGDATLCQTKTGKTSIKFEYSAKHYDYALHLHNVLKDYTVSEGPSIYLKSGKPHSCFFYTKTDCILNPLWDLFMKFGKKRFPRI